ncbi:MAG: hypothetical protein IAE80_00760 [Anaerolinea sp.]|nr:hypothetical protein [Anaerolinea sp.]
MSSINSHFKRIPYTYAVAPASQQGRIANAMPTNPAAMQPSQTGALEAADRVFSVAESSAGLGAS